MNQNRNSKDAFLLSSVKLFTIFVGTFSTMLLSKKLNLEVYGTYSTLNLIVTTGTSVSVLGLADAVNYFYNSEKNVERQKKYVSTIFSFQFIIGVITGMVIISSEPLLVNYFENNLLKGMCIYVAFRPYLANTILSLQNLQVAIGRAKEIAIRNALFSLVKIITIYICTFWIKDIRILLFMFLLMDFITVIYFSKVFAKEKFPIQIFNINKDILIEVLCLSIPMGLYIMSNTLMRDLDKYIIGYFESTSMLAIYTNCSTPLPLDVITNSFLVIIIPIMTRAIAEKDYYKAQCLFKNYFMIGLYSTLIFGIGIILVADEAISILYSDQYLEGKAIFVIYILASIIKFANLTLVLSARGRTKTLMILSLISLCINSVLNILLYYLLGVYGPAIATVFVTFINVIILTKISCSIIKLSFKEIISLKELLLLTGQIIFLIIIFHNFKNYLYGLGLDKYFILIICGGGFCFLMLGLNLKKILCILRDI